MQLTRRDTQLVRCLMQGKQNKEIATALGLTPNTVKVYFSRLFEKLGVSDRYELIMRAYADIEVRKAFFAGSELSESEAFLVIAKTVHLTAEQCREVLTILLRRCTR